MVEIVLRSKEKPMQEASVEIVERKGLGHPDTICDFVVEYIERELCKFYIENYGEILHHNIDKGVLVGGSVDVKFGEGKMLDPIYILVAGRATTIVDGDKVPIGEIVLDASKKFFREKFRFLDPNRHIIIDYRIRGGSQALVGLFKQKNLPANDTSTGVAYFPLTPLEKAVKEIELRLNDISTKRKYPFIGEDIKVKGVRIDDKIKVIIASAIVCTEVSSKEEYQNAVETVREIATQVLNENGLEGEVIVNAADIPEKGLFYLTLTGTSAEHGDDGCVGRGNRVNGLIPSCRGISMEAAAGKNPRTHVGKIYNILAYKIARRIYNECNCKEATVTITSVIGRPVLDPLMVAVEMVDGDVRHAGDVVKEMLSEDVLREIENEMVYGDMYPFY